VVGCGWEEGEDVAHDAFVINRVAVARGRWERQ
jgi:hypothetical protein